MTQEEITALVEENKALWRIINDVGAWAEEYANNATAIQT